MPLPSLIATKGGHVSELLQQAHNDPDPGHWYLNFTSAYEFNLYYQLTPRAIAVGGYYTFRWEPGMNPRLSTYLRLHPGQRRYGIVATDFPDAGGDDLIHLIIQSNFDPHPTSVRKLLALIVSLLCLGLLFHGWLVTTAWRNEMIRKANE
jgi:1-phosphatidylinositol phosphodiesterase